jgi:hypothetical protein
MCSTLQRGPYKTSGGAMRRTTVATGTIAAAVVLMLSACESAPPPQLPDVVGMNGSQAAEALEEYEVVYDAGDDSVWMASNWTVDAQSPAAAERLEEGEEVTLTVSKPAEETAPPVESTEPSATPTEAAPEAAPPTPDSNTTSAGLTSGWAMTGCNNAGEAQYPYGFNGDWIIDGTSQIVEDKWLLQAGATITNGYNAERRATVVCVVTGTDGAPVVESLIDY